MPSQYAVDHPTFPVNQRYFHLLSRPGRMLSHNDKPPDIWNSQGISGNVFANPPASSSSPYSGRFNPWISKATEDTRVLTSTGRPVACGERQISDTVLTPIFQPGPSAGYSFGPKEGRFFNAYVTSTTRKFRDENLKANR